MASEPDEGRKAPLPPLDITDYEQLIDDYSHFAPPAEGEVLQGHVLKVTPSEVIVDFGYKSEGLVPIAQFLQPDGSVSVRPGDPIDVVIENQIQRMRRLPVTEAMSFSAWRRDRRPSW